MKKRVGYLRRDSLNEATKGAKDYPHYLDQNGRIVALPNKGIPPEAGTWSCKLELDVLVEEVKRTAALYDQADAGKVRRDVFVE
jgi:hypothetical protein